MKKNSHIVLELEYKRARRRCVLRCIIALLFVVPPFLYLLLLNADQRSLAVLATFLGFAVAGVRIGVLEIKLYKRIWVVQRSEEKEHMVFYDEIDDYSVRKEIEVSAALVVIFGAIPVSVVTVLTKCYADDFSILITVISAAVGLWHIAKKLNDYLKK